MDPAKNDSADKSRRPAETPGRDRRLRTDAAASAEELRQFVTRMHGKSPQEVLGAVAESGLTRGIVISAIGALVILVAFTVGPYLVNRFSADTEPARARTPRRAADATEPNSTQAAAQQQPAEARPGPEEADLEKATDAMGIGETETADPDKNPLDDRLDSLLDGVD